MGKYYSDIKIEFDEDFFSFSESGETFYTKYYETKMSLEESRSYAHSFLEECYSDSTYPFILQLNQDAPQGYEENEFCYFLVINNDRELFKAFRDSYLKDAKNRTQYPLYGMECDRELIKLDKNIYIENDFRYKKCIEAYKDWKKIFIKKESEKLEIKYKKDKEISEIAYMNKLAEKYGYTLTKGE